MDQVVVSNVPVLIVASPVFAALVLPFLRRRARFLIHPVAVLGVGCGWLAAIDAMRIVLNTGGPIVHHFGGWAPPWGIEWRVDHLSAMMAVLITSLSLLVLIFARHGLDERLKDRAHLYFTLYLLFTAGLSGICVTGDLFNLYVFLEVSALTSYALIGVGEGNAPLAAFRYAILGTMAATAYLIGLAYIYGLTGSLNFVDVAHLLQHVGDNRTVFVALTFMVLGFGIKAAMFPMHAWLPDAYTFSPNTTTAFMAAVGTKVAAYGIFRVLYTIYNVTMSPSLEEVVHAMGYLAAIAIIGGSLLAIAQTDLKRMLAYSSVSQIGYVLLGFSLMNAAGITGAVLHIINHAVMKACLFLVTATIVAKTGHRDIRRFNGLGKRMPLTMAAFTVAALSMVGLPPLAGFFSKWYLVLGAVQAGRWPFVAVILLSSLLNAVYFFRILERVYLRPAEDTEAVSTTPIPLSMRIPVGVTALGAAVLGIASWPLVEHLVRFVVPHGM